MLCSIMEVPPWTALYRGILAATYYRYFLGKELLLYVEDVPFPVQG